ncbi:MULTISPECIES: MFS transporter [Methylobacterium]|uniref:MFS transporter n=1 Tax=Methylobacterium TaxID=407 RepID=UPI0013ED4B02|nr:MFS transporter [Methylobacterium sp. DB0501]NGM36609.1 MFS transporter [Methylobacterium sp. DB0501]
MRAGQDARQQESRQEARAIDPLAFHAATLGAFFAAAAAPTPLYRIYQETLALSPVFVTLVFAVYAVALLKALLVAGSLSDHLGRRPVIAGALLLEAAAMGLFLLVGNGAAWLIVARIVQGLATGIAAASLGAALVDVDRTRGPIVNAVAPLAGMALGALGTSALIQYAPLPLHLVYGLLMGTFAGLALAVRFIPESAATRPGALASLKPHMAVPPRIRRSLALVTPINLANWTLGGFYLSLVPSVVAAATGSRAPLTGGAVVTALMVAGAVSVLLRRGRAPRDNLTFGVLATALGVVIVVAGIHMASVPVLILGTLVTGGGFGASFLGCLGTIMPLAGPDERAGLLAAFYVQSYLAFSLPAVGAGLLARSLGYAATADLYAAAILAVSVGGLAALRARTEREPAA